jgi:transcriptional regulator with XRE-family HTH domain
MELTRLRELRDSAFLTQRELAERAGLTQASVARLETGKHRARPTTARRLAAALGVEPKELVAPRPRGETE